MQAQARRYSPLRAWGVAVIYFALCLLLARFSGAWAAMLQQPWVHVEQLQNPWWWVLSGVCAIVVSVAYGVIWPRGTFTDGRIAHTLLAPAYGFLWGVCQGLLFASIWLGLQRCGITGCWLFLSGFVFIGGYNALLHNFFWDIHVSPPHNYRRWNGKKVLFCHTPNLLACLSYLLVFGNVAIFAVLQGLALALSARAMHFPAPWDDYTAEAGLER